MNEHLLTRFADPLFKPTGDLQIGIFDKTMGKPVPNAKISVTPYNATNVIEELISDDSGQTLAISLESPPKELSLIPEESLQPYSQYTITVSADGFENVVVEGIQILADTTAIQNVEMIPANGMRQERIINILPHTLWGEFPPKIPEDEVKPLPESSGYVVLDTPVIPEYIIVHEGSPDVANKNYWVTYKNYIKNVASSEIYATWPNATIQANVLAIISFTLNRVFTEWYRNKGKNFTITNSTAYDHAFFYGRNIYKEISNIVDDIFSTYITRPGIRQPLFTQYCDGRRSSCPNWMTRWQKGI